MAQLNVIYFGNPHQKGQQVYKKMKCAGKIWVSILNSRMNTVTYLRVQMRCPPLLYHFPLFFQSFVMSCDMTIQLSHFEDFTWWIEIRRPQPTTNYNPIIYQPYLVQCPIQKSLEPTLTTTYFITMWGPIQLTQRWWLRGQHGRPRGRIVLNNSSGVKQVKNALRKISHVVT